ncbi:unnamed protein product [Hymenolepis diminuta]|uniref:Uncharacterized protein n=1 Tax=Hymenolepis diminuta TaxID=6216 RepID=A0A564Z825_HYMDI|nr:unnamed protein product [Hymenolepis diminuta]
MLRIARKYQFVLIVGLLFCVIILCNRIYKFPKSDLVNEDDLDSESSNRYNPEDLYGKINSPNHQFCQLLRKRYPIIDRADGDMDIAYTLVVHKDIKQIARLLRMIYRKNNYYCIHPDVKSGKRFAKALEGLISCFGPNVELVPKNKRVAVQWGDETVLLPQLICGEQALRRHSTWRYLINIVGQEFPLRTNLEIIAALKALNGSNLVEGFPVGEFIKRTKNKILPLNATWIKGSIYGAFRREFMEVAVLGKRMSIIRNFMLQPKMFSNPDEFYFNTLNFNPHLKLPGSCLVFPTPSAENGMGYLAKYVVWQGYPISCNTKYVRSVCILGNPHVEKLKKAPHLFANKFHANYQPEAYNALELWYFDRVQKESRTKSYDMEAFDPSIYANRTCSRLHQ